MEVEQALARIQGMFWRPRILVDEACRELRDWVRTSFRLPRGDGRSSQDRHRQ
jgi:hypothetical protein